MPDITTKDLVLTAVSSVFGDRDLTAIDRNFGPYVQHSSMAADGIEGLRHLATSLPEGFRYDVKRVLTDGDLVALHGVYHGFGPDPLVAFDIFRVQDGRIVEHWDALQPEVTATASGRSMTDGPTEPAGPESTEATRAVAEDMVDTILIGGDMSQLGRLFDGDAYAQHNPQIPDGLSGLGGALAAMAEQDITMVYTRRHLTVVEGDFALLQSEGTLGGVPTVFYDLFRVENGKIAEHWDVVFPVPESLPHSNGLI